MKKIVKIKKCLISVSDKSEIVKFAKNIAEKKIEIVSTGNTYNVIKQKGIISAQFRKIKNWLKYLIVTFNGSSR